MTDRAKLIALLALLLVFGAVVPVTYHLWLMPVSPEGMAPALFERGIGTPLLEWMNGRLGLFLNYRYMGALNWLLLPGLLAGLWAWPRLKRWHRGVLLFLLLSCLLVGGKGSFNYRYAMTMQPVAIMAVVLILARWLDGANASRKVAVRVMALAVFLTISNTALTLWHRQQIKHSEPGTSLGAAPVLQRLDVGPQDLDGWLSALGVAPDAWVLVNNLPAYYYTTTRPGHYYWCGNDQLYGANGVVNVFTGRTDEEVVRYLRDSLDTRYIFGQEKINVYEARFQSFLDTHCELLGTDPKGHTLHRLSDTFGR